MCSLLYNYSIIRDMIISYTVQHVKSKTDLLPLDVLLEKQVHGKRPGLTT